MDVIIKETLDYIVNYVEKPHPIFDNIPVCPFSKKFRLKDKINFIVYPFHALDFTILALADLFHAQQRYDSYFVIHPDKTLDLQFLVDFCDSFQKIIKPMGLLLFRGHPKDTFQVSNGVHTRREPYPSFQLLRESLVLESRNKLPESYFQNWLKGALVEDGII